jgi:hypothetical protein
MNGASFLDPIVSFAEEYQVVYLADSISDEKTYIVNSFELNYYPEPVILDFYPEKITLDMYPEKITLDM